MNNNSFDRYIRQTALPEIGIDGQRRLSNARVLCVGAGGLGSPALLYLAAAGIGHIGIAEFDTVNESNLHRQVLYSMNDIDEPKIDAAALRINEINPNVVVEKIKNGIKEETAGEVISNYDVALECTDSFRSKNMVCLSARDCKIPVVHAAVCGFKAQVSVFSPDLSAPCYRCLYRHSPEFRQNNAIIGPVAGLAGIVQAMQVIMLLTPHDDFEPLIGKLWEIDARTMKTRILNISKDKDCDVCK